VRIERDVMVAMRDGVELATDVYLPVGLEGQLPTILVRTQYGKDSYRERGKRESEALDFCGQGYAVVVQDLRGLFGSAGEYTLAAHDRPDGYDTLSWIAAQPWSNGRVGTIGCSSLGITQVLLAQECHPAHACAIAQASGGANGSAGDRWRLWDVHRGGAIEIGWAMQWFYEDGTKDHSRPKWRKDEEYAEALRSLPLVEMTDRIDSPPTDWEDWVSHPPGDPWWDRFGFLTDDAEIDVPTLFVNSWYDIGAADALCQHELFTRNARSQRARDNQRVIISPSQHCGSERIKYPTKSGDRDLGDAQIDIWRIYLDWFDAFLNDRPEAAAAVPTFRFFTMGANEWRTSDAWPPAGVEARPYYLHSGGGANTRHGDGALTLAAPGDEPPDTFTYDPADPVPNHGDGAGGPGCLCGARDHQAIELRDDVLCYSTEPLTERLEVTGPVKAVLHVSSSAPDTDFTAKLLDVYPDGRAFDLVQGIIRARYREGFGREVMMEPGGVYELEIDLDATSNVFAPGHRVRLEISSSNFPRFDRNLNTGGRNSHETEWAVAENTVHHTAAHPSYVLLPTVRVSG
jgi:putative CocE/NonD family hydrolase